MLKTLSVLFAFASTTALAAPPAGEPQTHGHAAAPAKASETRMIVGKAILPEGALKHAQPSAILYVIARKEGVQGGPPLAVKRLAQPFSKEMPFTLSPSDMMMPGLEFEGKIAITARLSQSGSATPPMKGDVETAKPVVAEVGKTRLVRLLIDTVRKQ